MARYFNCGIMATLLLCVSCRGPAYPSSAVSLPTDLQEKLPYDSNSITILPASAVSFFSLSDSLAAALTASDLPAIDSLLTLAIAKHNAGKDSTSLYAGFIVLQRYLRQYVPYTSVNGNKMVFINCFIRGLDNFPNWKTALVTIDDGGAAFFNTTINLSALSYGPVLINGPG